MAKKSTTKKSVSKKTIKPENVKHVQDLQIRIDFMSLKSSDKRKGNKNDKIVANLLDEKIAKYWVKQKADLEAEE